MKYKLTKVQRAKGLRLWQKCDAAFTAIFQDEQNTPWKECYARAPVELRNAYDDASRELRSFERELVEEGRGYFNAYGYFAEIGHTLSPWTEAPLAHMKP